MTTHAWHADAELLEEYVAGTLDATNGASVEQHLVRCATCRARIGEVVAPAPLERVWGRVRDAALSPPLPAVARVARRLGVSESTALLLAATPSLRVAWLAASFAAVGFAVVATMLSGDGSLVPFLLVAPMVPVLGVAAAYGHHDDPLEMLVATSPRGRTRLVAIRAVAVLLCVLPATALLGLLLPGPVWLAAAWLGPALALLPVLLALGAWIDPRSAAAGLAIVWSGLVLLAARYQPPMWPLEAPQQVGYLAVAVAAGLALLVRAGQDRRMGVLL